MQLYDDEIQGQTSPSTASKTSTAAWRQYATLPALPESIELRRQFWTNYLAACSTNFNSSIAFSEDRVSYLRNHALHNIDSLRKLASSQGLSLQSLFLAAYARTLCTESQAQESQSVVFGIYLANRSSDGHVLDATYPTLNLVPLRVQRPGDNLIKVAGAIQKDLQLIQSNGREHVGLWEIYSWTGIQVSTFVNFLSLVNEHDGPGKDGMLRKSSEDSWCRSDPELLKQPWLQDNAVREAYPVNTQCVPLSTSRQLMRVFQASLDIEASVNGSSLAIGIFGSTDGVSHDAAPRIVDDIVRCLMTLGANE
jgi:hypothetical protein